MTRYEECLAIARKLPEYFTLGGIDQMAEDFESDIVEVYSRDGQIIGFVSYRDNADIREITWLAVSPSYQRQGIASDLVHGVEGDARLAGITKIIVKTLADDNYEPYQKTRAFYEKLGYELAKIIDPYPGWDPGNPCGIYEKDLGEIED